MPDYRETTITIVEGEKTARCWTNQRTWIGKLQRLGATQTGKQAEGHWFESNYRNKFL